MSDQEITYLTDVSMITCVVQAGHGERILKAARAIGVSTGTISYHAKGVGARERLGLLGIAVETEKDVVSLLVSSEQRDIAFDALYKAGGLDTTGAGFIYVTPLEKMATYIPQSMLDKMKAKSG